MLRNNGVPVKIVSMRSVDDKFRSISVYMVANYRNVGR